MDAATYDRWYATPRGAWIGRRETALLRAALQCRPGESALDVGCGTGFFTRALAGTTTGTVAGVDANAAWIEYARGRGPDSISYYSADACALPFADRSFDIVIAMAALCFIEDQRGAVREMVRVARRRIAIGLLNRHSLLWYREGRHGGSGGYRGAQWHTVREALSLLADLPVRRVRVRTAIHLPDGGWFARALERVAPPRMPTGAFILVAADVTAANGAALTTPTTPAHGNRA